MRNSKHAIHTCIENTPRIELEEISSVRRDDVVKRLINDNNIGIELGVAEGVYAKRIIDSGKFSMLYGVDKYGGTKSHGTEEYKTALTRIGISDNRYTLLRMSFEEALGLFEDNYFDYIYVDGFAHTGQEGGKTLIDWYPKLKPGGLMAGDDYHEDWPLVRWAVNDFVNKLGVKLMVSGSEPGVKWCEYPTWFIEKPSNGILPSVNATLFELGQHEKIRDSKDKGKSALITRGIKAILSRFKK